MVAEEIVHQETGAAKTTKNRRKPVGRREVILAPDLFDAVLESIQQAKEGKLFSQEEVEQRNQP